ncbi:MAG: hypothetical protein ABL877_02310 [Thiobacillus sp.]
MKQQGFALVAAIVLVVVLAGLAAFSASILSGQSSNQQLERMMRDAELAAQAGLEWGGYRVMRGPAPVCAASTPLLLPPGTSLRPFNVVVTCNGVPNADGTVGVYQVAATASFGIESSPDYVERRKAAVFSR